MQNLTKRKVVQPFSFHKNTTSMVKCLHDLQKFLPGGTTVLVVSYPGHRNRFVTVPMMLCPKACCS